MVAATCRILQNYPTLVPFDSMLSSVMSKIPFNGDINENETVLKFAFNLYSICKYQQLILKLIFYYI